MQLGNVSNGSWSLTWKWKEHCLSEHPGAGLPPNVAGMWQENNELVKRTLGNWSHYAKLEALLVETKKKGIFTQAGH